MPRQSLKDLATQPMIHILTEALISFGGANVHVMLSTGSGFDAKTSWGTDLTYASGWNSYDDHPRAVADVDVGFRQGRIKVQNVLRGCRLTGDGNHDADIFRRGEDV